MPFLLELPPFKVPAWRVVVFRMYDRSLAFLKRAGTIILATTILVWALSYYPYSDQITQEFAARRATAAAAEHESLAIEEAGERLRQSYPFAVYCPVRTACTELLLSKLPLGTTTISGQKAQSLPSTSLSRALCPEPCANANSGSRSAA